jgi:hypothetical protein
MGTLQPPTPRIADGFWEYNCMLLMMRMGVKEITLTPEDQANFYTKYGTATLSVTASSKSLTLQIYSEAEIKSREGK